MSLFFFVLNVSASLDPRSLRTYVDLDAPPEAAATVEPLIPS
jgi:hypothetical protein